MIINLERLELKFRSRFHLPLIFLAHQARNEHMTKPYHKLEKCGNTCFRDIVNFYIDTTF